MSPTGIPATESNGAMAIAKRCRQNPVPLALLAQVLNCNPYLRKIFSKVELRKAITDLFGQPNLPRPSPNQGFEHLLILCFLLVSYLLWLVDRGIPRSNEGIRVSAFFTSPEAK